VFHWNALRQAFQASSARVRKLEYAHWHYTKVARSSTQDLNTIATLYFEK